MCKSLICCSIFNNNNNVNAIQKGKQVRIVIKIAKLKVRSSKTHLLLPGYHESKKIQYNGFFSINCSIKYRILCQFFPANIRYTQSKTNIQVALVNNNSAGLYQISSQLLRVVLYVQLLRYYIVT